MTETVLRVDGDSTGGQRALRGAGDAAEELSRELERVGRSGQGMGRDVSVGADRAADSIGALNAKMGDGAGFASRFGDSIVDVGLGVVTADKFTALLEGSIEALGRSFVTYTQETATAREEAEQLTRVVDELGETFAQSAYGDGSAEVAIRAVTQALEDQEGPARRAGGLVQDFLDVSSALVQVSNDTRDFTDSISVMGVSLSDVTDKALNVLNPLSGLTDVFGNLGDAARAYTADARDMVQAQQDIAHATELATTSAGLFSDVLRGANTHLRAIDIPPQQSEHVLDFFEQAAAHALNASQSTASFRRTIQQLSGIDPFNLVPDEEAAASSTARVTERQESTIKEYNRKQAELLAEQVAAAEAAAQAQADAVQRAADRQTEIRQLRFEQDVERAEMAAQKDMELHQRQIARLEATAVKEQEVQQRRQDAVSAYLGGFDQQVASVLAGTQTLEEGMRAAFGGIASAAADAAIAQAGILLFTPGGQGAAAGLFAAAVTARVVASALGYQGGAASGPASTSTSTTNINVSVGEGGSAGVGTGRAIAETIRDSMERGAV